MQGRLLPPVGDSIQSFPRDNWESEFEFASDASLKCIEWIYDLYGKEENPLKTREGIDRLKELSQQHGVAVRSLCADYFMEKFLLNSTRREGEAHLNTLRWLLNQCHLGGIERIVLPFVDQSSVTSAAEEAQLIELLNDILPLARNLRVELHLEMDLNPTSFAAFLERVPDPILKVNYDSGNSAALGYSAQEEFAAYGERIGSVHIKDRQRGGGTVPLGTGDTDFYAVFSGLKSLNYEGDFILQVARGGAGDEIFWAKKNRSFVEALWLEGQ
jgi:hexulose-6-phosphate isomerase